MPPPRAQHGWLIRALFGPTGEPPSSLGALLPSAHLEGDKCTQPWPLGANPTFSAGSGRRREEGKASSITLHARTMPLACCMDSLAF